VHTLTRLLVQSPLLLPLHITGSVGPTSSLGELKFQGGGDLYRRFLTPPEGAQWCDLVITDLRTLTDNSNYCDTDGSAVTTAVPAADPTSSSSGSSSSGSNAVASSSSAGSSGARSKQDVKRMLMVLHALQLLPHTPYRDAEKQVYLQLLPGQAEVTVIFNHLNIRYLISEVDHVIISSWHAIDSQKCCGCLCIVTSVLL
jgi:hypothetical protein